MARKPKSWFQYLVEGSFWAFVLVKVIQVVMVAMGAG
jgi:hypothetical protein